MLYEVITSNICTAQVLLAVIAGMYAVYHGPEGLRRIARRVHTLSGRLADAVTRMGFALLHETYFDTLAIEVGAARPAIETAFAAGGPDCAGRYALAPAFGQPPGRLARITSYNVCYTKLLRTRGRRARLPPPSGSTAPAPRPRARR